MPTDTRKMDNDNGNTKLEQLKLTVVTLNVRGLNDYSKRKCILQWIKNNNADIVFLQETFITTKLERQLHREYKHWGTIITANSTSNHSRGVATLISNRLKCEIIESHKDDDGRVLLLNTTIQNNKLSLVNIYAPCVQNLRIRFFNNIHKLLSNKIPSTYHTITGGDMNTTDDILDRVNMKIEPCVKIYKRFKTVTNLEDAWKYLNPQKREYTYIDTKTNKGVSRIDHILVSPSILSHISKAEIKIAPTPDHKAVILKIDTNHNTRGKGYWKLNNLLLDDTEYCEIIRKIFQKTKAEYISQTSLHNIWELCKIRFKEFSIAFSINRIKKFKTKITKIENEINSIDKYLACNNRDDDLIDKRKQLKSEYENLLREKSDGAKIRAKAKWWEQGERSSAYFLNLENIRQSNNKINRITNNSGEIVTHDDDILESAAQFYERLYSSSKTDANEIKKYLQETYINKTLTSDEAKLCEGYINSNECSDVIKKLKLNKSPGLDGLTAEFYKTFWDEIGEFLIDVYNSSCDNITLPISQNHSIISLIYKKGDISNLKNYRPISITNIDYKIVAFVLANRLHKIMNKIISTEQTGFIRKRFIGQNIRLIQDIIHISKFHHNAGIILFLDFEKAFDSIEWNFIFLTLKRMNFGENFINWIKTLYSNPTASIKNNGWKSRNFNLYRGVKQGCPISALLFTIAVEILASRIKQSKNLKGYNMRKYDKSKEIRISQYADDTQIFLSDEKQIPEVISIINEFTRLAGPKLNIEKTEGIRLGTANKTNECIYGINIKSDPIKCLGIYIGVNVEQCNKLNWKGPIEQMELLLNTWKRRDLTLFGKITIIKTLCLSKLNNILMNCEHEHEHLKYINKLFYNFLWGKRDRIKRNVMINNIEDGGVSMVDIESHCESLKAGWIKRMINDEDCNWNFLSKMYLQSFGKDYQILQCNFISESMFPQMLTLPRFYRQIMTSYCKSKIVNKPNTKELILEQYIWGNRHITYYDKHSKSESSIYFTNFIETGINKVRDLKFHNGIIDEYYIYNTVTRKNNILIEIALLRKALHKYKHIMGTHSPDRNTTPTQTYKHDLPNNKAIYKSLIKQKSCKSRSIVKWSERIGTTNQLESFIYTNKIKIKDKKIAEFNFKIINNILACKLNLYTWKLANDSKCEICGEVQDIIHLLYQCENSKNVWNYVEARLHIKITQSSIIYGVRNENIKTYVISLISYLIYKEWIISNNNKISRTTATLRAFILPELYERQKLYKYMKETEINTEIGKLTM